MDVSQDHSKSTLNQYNIKKLLFYIKTKSQRSLDGEALN